MSRKEQGSVHRARGLRQNQGEGPNWVLITGGALLTTLSIKLGCKLRRHFKARQTTDTTGTTRGNKSYTVDERQEAYKRQSYLNCCSQNGDGCHCCNSGKDLGLDITKALTSPLSKGADTYFPLIKIPSSGVDQDCYDAAWTSSPERFELQRLTLHHSNSSDSLGISETGSDIYSKRAVIKKLRQQLKRRDEMIMEMQAQVSELQNSLQSRATQTANLRSQLHSAQRELFDSQLEIQRLRKAIADHCAAACTADEPVTAKNFLGKACNGHMNGYHESQNTLDSDSETVIITSDRKSLMLLGE